MAKRIDDFDTHGGTIGEIFGAAPQAVALYAASPASGLGVFHLGVFQAPNLAATSTPANGLGAGGFALMAPAASHFTNDALVAPDDIMSAGTAGGGTVGATTLTKVYNSGTGLYQYTGNQDIDGTLSGDTWTGTNLTYSFPTDKTFYGSGYAANGSTSVANNFVVTNAAQQAAARAAFALISSYTLLTFTEITESASVHATIRLSQSTSAYVPSAFAYYPYTDRYAGDVWIGKHDAGPEPFYTTPAQGNWGYAMILHEIGHTMGLKHGHETDNLGAVPAERDGWAWSLMTYQSDPGNTEAAGLTFQGDEFSQPQTYMQDDIAAMQYMYGANFSTNGGNSVYTVSATTGELFINGVGQGTPTSNKTFLTIWDGGGSDTYDFSNFTGDQTIDLTPGGWSTDSATALIDTRPLDSAVTLLAPGNIANALLYNADLRSLIENATAGSGNDTLVGNQIANTLNGGDGNDRIDGGAGADTLAGGDGNDTLVGSDGNDWIDGGAGVDSMSGGSGNDTYIVDNYGDTVFEDGPAGDIDEVRASVGYGLTDNVEDLILTGGANVNGIGNALNNHITGNDGRNTLDGGDGDDTLAGGLGDDTYVVLQAGDVVIEAANAGIDTVKTQLSYTLGDNVENLLILVWDSDGTGNGLNNAISGGSGSNHLYGLAGNDTLDGENGNDTLDGGDGDDVLQGGGGDDSMAGGLGNDTYYSGDASDLFSEAANAGVDTLITGVTGILGANFENLTLDGNGNINGTGNQLNNVLTGNSGNNALDGGVGNDLITGGGGNDTLTGGAGNDTFVVDSLSTVLVEVSGSGSGTDLVSASITYSLIANIENLTLTGAADINATGNTAANTLTGNDGSNVLDGKTGADKMAGGLGNDTYYVDNSGDTVVEAANGGTDLVYSSVTFSAAGQNIENVTLTGVAAIDATGNKLNNALTGNSAANLLTGGDGNDTLAGGLGADTMDGGDGGDNFYVDDGGDVVTDSATGTGSDAIVTSVSYTLSAYVENLTANTANAITLTGNGLGNTITGNDAGDVIDAGDGNDSLLAGGGNDTLLGGAGDDYLFGSDGGDSMAGGLGNDTYNVFDGNDIIVEAAGEGIDLVTSTVSYTLTANVENLVLIFYADLSGTGNDLNNSLQGTYGGNLLTGGLGNDTLSGMEGNDTLLGGEGNDSIDGGPGADSLTGGTGNDTFVVDDAGDVLVELSGGGADLILSSVTYAAIANIENLTLTGIANINATGNSAVNILIGNDGNNLIDGKTGGDKMSGGLGDDTYVVDNAGDVVTEAAGQGTDTVNSSITVALSANVENLVLTGTAAITGTGNELANSLTGNSAANLLTGGGGADTLTGGLGNDTLQGGDGGDVYYIDAGDVVSEDAGGTAIDWVYVDFTYTLAANVEYASITGAGATNLTGNALNNVLAGNDAANTLNGGDGDDSLQSAGGNDSLSGGLGTDFLVGGGGDDTMAGGLGDDYYVVTDGGDVVVEAAGEGTDLIYAFFSYTLGANIESLYLSGGTLDGTGNELNNLFWGTESANHLYGLAGNDTLNSYGGADTLDGGTGNDWLDGGTGADSMTGGTGNDTFVVDNAGDIVVELSGGGGTDTVMSYLSYTLLANFETLSLMGTGDLTGTGNSAANTLGGNDGNNLLDGKAGNDTMAGGAGNDTYLVDAAGDVLTENTGEGTDTVRTALSYTLGANVENLELTGTAAVSGTGNDLANSLTGNAAANALSGGLGDDTLIGGLGADTLTGGLGADVYYIDNSADVIVEIAKQGLDTAYASASYVLAAGVAVEVLTLTGTAAINATGNEFANTLNGNSGHNRLDGGLGADTLTGGTGNDTYVVDNAGDVVVELSGGGGVDLVESSIAYSLAGNVENLTLTGSANIGGTGNSAANILTGNAGDNALDGKAGHDQLSGGIGNDTVSGGAGNDTMSGGTGGDLFVFNITDTASASASDRVLDLDFGSGDAFSLVGFDGTTTAIDSYHGLAQFVVGTGATVSAGTAVGSAQIVLAGANGHTQTIEITDTSGHGTALQQLQAATSSLDALSTSLPMGSELMVLARLVGPGGQVIQSEGNNGWIRLDTFATTFSSGVGLMSLAFGGDRAATSLLAAQVNNSLLSIEVEAYQTYKGSLQLVDQYLFSNAQVAIPSQSADLSTLTFTVSSFEHDHWARDSKGNLQTPTELGWNLDNGKQVNLSDQASFLTDGAVAGGQGEGALGYVVRFLDSTGNVIASEGTNGWTALANYSLSTGDIRALNFSMASGYLSNAVSLAMEQYKTLRVEIESYRTLADHSVVTVDDLLFSNVTVNTRTADGAGTETLTLGFSRFQEVHNALDKTGAIVSTTQFGWDYQSHKGAPISDPGNFTSDDHLVAAPGDRLLVARFVDSKGSVIATEGSDGWIVLDSMDFSTLPSSFSGGTTPFGVQLAFGQSSLLAVALEKLVLNGTAISFQVESLSRFNGQYQLVDEYLFANATVDQTQLTGAIFQAGAFSHSYTERQADGTAIDTVSTGWDVNSQKESSLPDPADFIPGTSQAADPGDDLIYVVRFLNGKGLAIASDAGNDGWISATMTGGLSLSDPSNNATGTVHFSDDKAYVALASAMVSGSAISMDVEAYRMTASGLQLVDDYLFSKVSIDTLIDGSGGGGELAFQSAQFSHSHTAYTEKGTVSQVVTSAWDVTNQKVIGPTDAGNYATAGTGIALDGPTPLTYYARFVDSKGAPLVSEGDGGWIALDGYAGILGTSDAYASLSFGSDEVSLALSRALLSGTTSLKLEIDGFSGAQLVDQSLFSRVSVRSVNLSPDQSSVTVGFGAFQLTHDINVSGGTTFGWDLSSNKAATLTSGGVYSGALAAGGAAGDVTYYVRLVDKNGQTILTDGGHTFTPVSGFELGLSESTTNNGEFHLGLGLDQAGMGAFAAYLAGYTLSRVEIEGYIDGPNGPRLIDEYLLDGVEITSLSEGASTTYTVMDLNADKFQVAHYVANGAGFDPVIFGWDFGNNVATSLTAPHADIFA